jgi:hypothetical protein
VTVEVSHITPEFVETFYEGAIDGWYDDGPIDWEAALLSFEHGTSWDFGTTMDSPAIRKLQRMVRQHRAENGIF